MKKKQESQFHNIILAVVVLTAVAGMVFVFKSNVDVGKAGYGADMTPAKFHGSECSTDSDCSRHGPYARCMVYALDIENWCRVYEGSYATAGRILCEESRRGVCITPPLRKGSKPADTQTRPAGWPAEDVEDDGDLIEQYVSSDDGGETDSRDIIEDILSEGESDDTIAGGFEEDEPSIPVVVGPEYDIPEDKRTVQYDKIK